jgi:hypothetical protein
MFDNIENNKTLTSNIVVYKTEIKIIKHCFKGTIRIKNIEHKHYN